MSHCGINRRRLVLCLLACCLLPGMAGLSSAWAVTIYSYVDHQGNMVYTDAFETIPPKYRSKVKTHERPDPVTHAPSFLRSVEATIQDQTKNAVVKMPSFRMEGLTPEQSRLLTFAGGIAVILLVVMYVSKSPLIRLLGLCLLIALGIGTPVLVYVSDGGPMDVMKTKASTAGQAQLNRLQEMGR
jgi:hypothetical protein